MLTYEPGRAVVSLQGHDKGKVYILLKEEGRDVLLTDGRLRPIENPKRKRKLHIQLMKATDLVKSFSSDGKLTNEAVRDILNTEV